MLGCRRIVAPTLLVLVSCLCAIVGVRSGSTLPVYAARTGLECRSCHFDPNGGGPRNGLGFTFSRQRHDLAVDPDTSWAQLPTTNRLGDAIFVGTNTRMIYLYTRPQDSKVADLSSFFQMQGTLNVTIQPYPQLAIVMVRDFGEFTGDLTRDLYGMIQDSGGHMYVRAGRIRPVFGLRQDDHTSATRGGFENTAAGGTGGLLPYDPHAVESGMEGGVFHGPLGFELSATNTGTAFGNKAKAVSTKLTSVIPNGHVGVSFYNRFRTNHRDRATRWGGYLLLRTPGLPDLTWLGEVGFGTDEDGAGGVRNAVASFGEVDYRVSRAILLRGKYDYSDPFRSLDGSAAERFLLETDLTIVPFADLKISYREVVPENTGNEHQALAMVHFYY